MRSVFFVQAEDGIRDLVRSRGLGDVYKRQVFNLHQKPELPVFKTLAEWTGLEPATPGVTGRYSCLLYTSDAADERSSVDLGGRRILKKKQKEHNGCVRRSTNTQPHHNSQRTEITCRTTRRR